MKNCFMHYSQYNPHIKFIIYTEILPVIKYFVINVKLVPGLQRFPQWKRGSEHGTSKPSGMLHSPVGSCMGFYRLEAIYLLMCQIVFCC